MIRVCLPRRARLGRLGILFAATLLGGCETPKEELADSAAARADVRRDYAAKAGLVDVSAYLTAKAAYIKAYQLRVDSSKTMSVGADSVMKELEARLKAIVGPVSIQGRGVPARINPDGLPSAGSEGGRELDGLRVINGDSITIVVSTPELVTAWLRYHGDSAGDPLVGLTSDEMLTQAVYTGAALSHYADIPTNPDTSRGVFFAALLMRAQDYSAEPPDEVIVGARRGNRIFLLFAKARATIAPSPACRRVWDSLAVAAAGGDAAYQVYRECYGIRASKEAAFEKLVAQVRDLVTLLPER